MYCSLWETAFREFEATFVVPISRHCTFMCSHTSTCFGLIATFCSFEVLREPRDTYAAASINTEMTQYQHVLINKGFLIDLYDLSRTKSRQSTKQYACRIHCLLILKIYKFSLINHGSFVVFMNNLIKFVHQTVTN